MPGPFIFQWADPNALPFDAGVHALSNDLHVLGFNITQDEGDFPSMEMTVVNPREGLLAPGRQVWGWLSYDKDWVPGEGHTPDIVPLFYGRLIGFPEDLHDEVVIFNFVARPVDYVDQKIALAESLKVRPYWDPIWFSPENRDDPDNVLESRPELWHIDRITHEVTTSDILVGEDGTINIEEDENFYDSMSVSFGSSPLRKVLVRASVAWNQSYSSTVLGSFDLRRWLGNSILSYTGKALIENWPKTGDSLGGGWAVAEGGAERIDSVAVATWMYEGIYPEPELVYIEGTPFLDRRAMARPPQPEIAFSVQVPYWASAGGFSVGTAITYNWPRRVLVVPCIRVRPTLKIGLDVSRGRTESIAFSLEANVQAIKTDGDDEEVLELSFSSSEIMSAIDPSGSDSIGNMMPLRDTRAASYFATDRGAESLEYLIALARSRLLARARAVDIEFDIPFNLAVDLELSCRKSLAITDYRLPGGTAAGKIVGYSLSCDGDSGALSCTVHIGCSIGEGGTVSAVPGDPTYVEDGYVDDPYQVRLNAYVMPIAGEVAYASINGTQPNDDGINFFGLTADEIVLDYALSGSRAEQESAMGINAAEPAEVFARLDTIPTTVTLALRNMEGGPFNTDYAVPMTMLSVPKTIDLAAESTS